MTGVPKRSQPPPTQRSGFSRRASAASNYTYGRAARAFSMYCGSDRNGSHQPPYSVTAEVRRGVAVSASQPHRRAAVAVIAIGCRAIFRSAHVGPRAVMRLRRDGRGRVAGPEIVPRTSMRRDRCSEKSLLVAPVEKRPGRLMSKMMTRRLSRR